MRDEVKVEGAIRRVSKLKVRREILKPWGMAWPGIILLTSQAVHGQMPDSSLSTSQPSASTLSGLEGDSRIGAGYADRSARGLIIQPRLTIRSTYTNNVDLSAQNRRSDIITEVAPGINIISNGSKVRGYFDYSLSKITYANDTSLNSVQRTLNTRITAEIISNWLFVEASGSISRQAISAFGQQSSDTSRTNSNFTEVTYYRVSPYIQGRLDNIANYQLRYAESVLTSNAETVASDVRVTDITGLLSEEYATRRTGWAFRFSSKMADYKEGQDTQNTQLVGELNYAIRPQLKILGFEGKEKNNYLTSEEKLYSIYGYGFKWRPTERTQIDGELNHRFFGKGHRFVFIHRLQRLAWQYSDVKDVVIDQNLEGINGSSSALFDVLFSQFSSVEPDPIRRAQLVNDFIRANGLSANTLVNGGFLTSGVRLQRRQQLSLSWIGSRNIVSLLGNQSNDTRVNDFFVRFDDLNTAPNIKQHGYGIQFSRALTTRSNLNFSFLSQRSVGTQVFQKSSLQSFSANYSYSIGAKSVVTFGARQSKFSGNAESYHELAIYGQLSMRF